MNTGTGRHDDGFISRWRDRLAAAPLGLANDWRAVQRARSTQRAQDDAQPLILALAYMALAGLVAVAIDILGSGLGLRAWATVAALALASASTAQRGTRRDAGAALLGSAALAVGWGVAVAVPPAEPRPLTLMIVGGLLAIAAGNGWATLGWSSGAALATHTARAGLAGLATLGLGLLFAGGAGLWLSPGVVALLVSIAGWVALMVTTRLVVRIAYAAVWRWRGADIDDSGVERLGADVARLWLWVCLAAETRGKAAARGTSAAADRLRSRCAVTVLPARRHGGRRAATVLPAGRPAPRLPRFPLARIALSLDMVLVAIDTAFANQAPDLFRAAGLVEQLRVAWGMESVDPIMRCLVLGFVAAGFGTAYWFVRGAAHPGRAVVVGSHAVAGCAFLLMWPLMSLGPVAGLVVLGLAHVLIGASLAVALVMRSAWMRGGKGSANVTLELLVLFLSMAMIFGTSALTQGYSLATATTVIGIVFLLLSLALALWPGLPAAERSERRTPVAVLCRRPGVLRGGFAGLAAFAVISLVYAVLVQRMSILGFSPQAQSALNTTPAILAALAGMWVWRRRADEAPRAALKWGFIWMGVALVLLMLGDRLTGAAFYAVHGTALLAAQFGLLAVNSLLQNRLLRVVAGEQKAAPAQKMQFYALSRYAGGTLGGLLPTFGERPWVVLLLALVVLAWAYAAVREMSSASPLLEGLHTDGTAECVLLFDAAGRIVALTRHDDRWHASLLGAEGNVRFTGVSGTGVRDELVKVQLARRVLPVVWRGGRLRWTGSGTFTRLRKRRWVRAALTATTVDARTLSDDARAAYTAAGFTTWRPRAFRVAVDVRAALARGHEGLAIELLQVQPSR